ncbi:MAG: mechanosensitive ion channel [Ignavibacteria bacterium]|nr:mechanosensitive ion channel [Ignavibacteria bacterium]
MLFIFIILISTLISKAVSFYADKADNSGKARLRDSAKSGGLSNWMLLIRIGVISIGTLLAFAATGLPIDKMTLIIGSLGVGVGLGLQSVVNNLVSGIMLAFEKPFKIGDYIEIGDEAGRIKEIGIRSSKLSTSEGADIIIPNGDLLSKHVINWTLSNSQKRSELILKINSGKKLNEVKTVFLNIMDMNENIEKNPKPEVLMNHFSGSDAEYRLLYWTYIDQEDQVRSELIVAVEDELKKSGYRA